ncbi:MAG: hypothetical protein WCO09_00125 [bacterium]
MNTPIKTAVTLLPSYLNSHGGSTMSDDECIWRLAILTIKDTNKLQDIYDSEPEGSPESEFVHRALERRRSEYVACHASNLTEAISNYNTFPKDSHEKDLAMLDVYDFLLDMCTTSCRVDENETREKGCRGVLLSQSPKLVLV